MSNRCSVKPLPVHKSLCLLIRPFNHQQNKGNTSLHPPPSLTIVLSIFMNSITLNMMTNVYVLFFQFSLRERRPQYDVTKNDVTLYDVTLRRSNIDWIVWIRLFYKHAKFQQVTLHSLWNIRQLSVIFDWPWYRNHQNKVLIGNVKVMLYRNHQNKDATRKRQSYAI